MRDRASAPWKRRAEAVNFLGPVPLPLPLRLALALAALLPACASVPAAIADLRALHEETPAGKIRHLEEVVRPSRLGRSLRASFLARLFPGLPDALAKPRPEKIADPARLCRERILELRDADRSDLAETVEVLYWATVLLEADPSPLARADAAEVVALLLPAGDRLLPARAEAGRRYEADVREALRSILELHERSRAESLDSGLREEYLSRIATLGLAPYRRAGEARGVARALARLRGLEEDPAARDGLRQAALRASSRAGRLALRAAESDPSEFVRESVASARFRLDGVEALRELTPSLLGDTSASVRRRVVLLFREVHPDTPPEAVEPLLEPLVRAVSDPDSSVATNAMEALARLSRSPLLLDRNHWRGWWQERLLLEPNPGDS